MNRLPLKEERSPVLAATPQELKDTVPFSRVMKTHLSNVLQALSRVGLAKLSLGFPEFPSLYASNLGLTSRELGVGFGR